MSRWDNWGYYRSSTPRQVKDGIKAKSQTGRIGETWWSTRFIDILESFNMGARLGRGRTYARKGQVMNLKVAPGLVTAKVQGSSARPYAVEIRQDSLDDAEWEKVMSAMSEQALFMAKLLAGEMPHEIEEAFATAQTALFPKSEDELETDCSCPDWANPCKHIAAAFYILAEAFDEDPFLIFAFRGRTKEQVIEKLRGMRAAVAQDEISSFDGPLTPQVESPPLASCIENFWQAGANLSELRLRPVVTTVPDAVLRELGLAPIHVRDINLTDFLSPAYATLTKLAAEPGTDETE